MCNRHRLQRVLDRYAQVILVNSLLILLDINRDIITATAVIAGIGSFAFGFFTNLPVALA